jgi:hypothetical protein
MGTKKRKKYRSVKVEDGTYLKLRKIAGRRGESLSQTINWKFKFTNNGR